ncbi:MAG: hypothetical protein IKK50_08745 [Ruminiclostridium sp.]|nr:hypothetical protein [Ruminiclostridium sp.]
MKQHKTLFLLFLRHTAWKVLLILAGSAVLQAALFRFLMPDPTQYSLETVLQNTESYLWWVVLLTFAVIVGLLLSASTVRGKGRTDYLLDRLAVPPQEVILCQGIYNALAVLLFWAAEALVLLGLCRMYGAMGGHLGPQTIFLATWQNDLLHSFLPTEEVSRWVRNLIWCAAVGFAAAAGSAQLRQKGKAVGIFFLIGLSGALFRCPMGNLGLDVVYSLLSLAVTAAVLYNAFTMRKEGDYEEEAS